MDQSDVSRVLEALARLDGAQTYLLSQTWPASHRKAVARHQQRLYEHKPWRLGIPTHDVLGNRLCFREEGTPLSARYWIYELRQNGAHIRVHEDGLRFTVIAPTEQQALLMGTLFAAERDLEKPSIHHQCGRGDGWAVIECRAQRRSLD